MRLKQDHDSPATRTEFCSRERCSDFSGMMSVVVDDQHVVDFAFRLKSAARAGEAVKSLDDLFKRNFQLEANRDRRECVIDVVHTGNAQNHFTNDIRPAPYVE